MSSLKLLKAMAPSDSFPYTNNLVLCNVYLCQLCCMQLHVTILHKQALQNKMSDKLPS